MPRSADGAFFLAFGQAGLRARKNSQTPRYYERAKNRGDITKPRDIAILAGLNTPALRRRQRQPRRPWMSWRPPCETSAGPDRCQLLPNRAAPDPRTFIAEGKGRSSRKLEETSPAHHRFTLTTTSGPPSLRVLTGEWGAGSGPQAPYHGHLRQRARTGRAASRWSWPSTSTCCPGSRHVDPPGASGRHQRQGTHRSKGPAKPSWRRTAAHPPEDRTQG